MIALLHRFNRGIKPPHTYTHSASSIPVFPSVPEKGTARWRFMFGPLPSLQFVVVLVMLGHNFLFRY